MSGCRSTGRRKAGGPKALHPSWVLDAALAGRLEELPRNLPSLDELGVSQGMMEAAQGSPAAQMVSVSSTGVYQFLCERLCIWRIRGNHPVLALSHCCLTRIIILCIKLRYQRTIR